MNEPSKWCGSNCCQTRSLSRSLRNDPREVKPIQTDKGAHATLVFATTAQCESTLAEQWKKMMLHKSMVSGGVPTLRIVPSEVSFLTYKIWVMAGLHINVMVLTNKVLQYHSPISFYQIGEDRPLN